MPAAAVRPDGDLPSPENLLQEYKELRERFQRTTNALASAAHDLKTPLSILIGYVEVLHSEKLGSLNGPGQREVLHDMQASGKRLQQSFGFPLTYSRPRNREGCACSSRAAISTSVCLKSPACGPSLSAKGAGALYFLANDKLPIFSFDTPKLERVISNLLENSFKFTSSGGNGVAARRAHICGNGGRRLSLRWPNAAVKM